MKIVQCWDDGVSSDIRLLEILRNHGARASFNLNFALHGSTRGPGWKFKNTDVIRLAQSELKSVYDGFLVANHSLSHPHLEQIAPDAAAREIADNRDALEQFFGFPVTGFAYPFGTFSESVKQQVRASGHVYARTCANAAQVFPCADTMEQPTNCHFLAPAFWDRFERAGEVFYFWGHSYELVTEEMWDDFDAKIERLSASGEWADLPEVFGA